MDSIQEQLFAMQDIKYRDFHSRLIPNINKENVIGIRVPVLRKYAKEISGSIEAEQFIKQLPHTYYEENNLHMMLITSIKDYDKCIKEVNRFLPYIDNWATCDFAPPSCFKKHRKELLSEIDVWINSEDTYTVRYGIGMLMRLYLDETFDVKYVRKVAGVISDEYYINMMIAWYMATALAKQWDAVIPFIEDKKLPVWVHNKTIQKAVESYRITDEQKTYLKTFKIR